MIAKPRIFICLKFKHLKFFAFFFLPMVVCGQTGFSSRILDTTSIDSLAFIEPQSSHGRYEACYSQGELCRIFIDHIGNSSGTTIYHLEKGELKVYESAYEGYGPRISNYSTCYFENGKMVKWNTFNDYPKNYQIKEKKKSKSTKKNRSVEEKQQPNEDVNSPEFKQKEEQVLKIFDIELETIKIKGLELRKKTHPNYFLLQGKWQNEKDKTNFLVFEDNIKKEIGSEMSSLETEKFILSDECRNSAGTKYPDDIELDRYISCKESNVCWYIYTLNEERLTLMYLPNGNFLHYSRLKE